MTGHKQIIPANINISKQTLTTGLKGKIVAYVSFRN